MSEVSAPVSQYFPLEPTYIIIGKSTTALSIIVIINALLC